MKNLTLAIEDNLLLSARRLALERSTTVNALVRDYLQDLVEQDGRQREALSALRLLIRNGAFEVGERTWTRDELHD